LMRAVKGSLGHSLYKDIYEVGGYSSVTRADQLWYDAHVLHLE